MRGEKSVEDGGQSMVRIIGFFIILIGSCGCGFSIVKERADYLERCRHWRELLEMMENEMAFQKSSLPEICSRVGRHLSGSRKQFLKKIEEAFAENRGETLGEVWRQEAKQAFQKEPLKKGLQEEMENLGGKLCFEDSSMQRKVLRDMQERLKKHEEEQENLNREKNKLTLCAGVLGGLLITVLLL